MSTLSLGVQRASPLAGSILGHGGCATGGSSAGYSSMYGGLVLLLAGCSRCQEGTPCDPPPSKNAERKRCEAGQGVFGCECNKSGECEDCTCVGGVFEPGE